MDVPSGCIKALDELLDLPHLNVLLCLILTHFGNEFCSSELSICTTENDKTQTGGAPKRKGVMVDKEEKENALPQFYEKN